MLILRKDALFLVLAGCRWFLVGQVAHKITGQPQRLVDYGEKDFFCRKLKLIGLISSPLDPDGYREG